MIKSQDALNADFRAKMVAALKGEDPEAFAKSIEEYTREVVFTDFADLAKQGKSPFQRNRHFHA